MRQVAIILYILAIASAVFGLLGAVSVIDFNFFAAVFLFLLFKEISEIAITYSLALES